MTTQTTEPRPMKPYLINAVLDYCRDTGTTPYVMVAVDHACRVPQEIRARRPHHLRPHGRGREQACHFDTELTFQARFGENNEIFDVLVPLNRIIAVTPLECQQFALHFEVTETPVEEPEEAPAQPAPAFAARCA